MPCAASTYDLGVNHASVPYISEARESLAGAESELANGRYNNATNRAYYAAFQAAVGALIAAGIVRRNLGHDNVQAQFAGQLINRRKQYSGDLRSVLPELAIIRLQADYEPRMVSSSTASRVVRAAGHFVRQVART